jgi:3',5'-cyclic AMP phosphodiesterase CpdA
MAVFHVAHLSDLHFGEFANRGNLLSNTLRRRLASVWRRRHALPPTHNPQRADRVAAWIYAHAHGLAAAGDQLDALVLSGDLATTGIKDDLEAALRYIDTAPSYLWYRRPNPGDGPATQHLATLKNLARHCLLIPGNHDRFQSNNCEPGGQVFDTVFDSYWRKNVNGVVGKIIPKPATSANTTSPVERLAILGADCCLRSSADASFAWTEKSQGYVHDDTIKALISKTEDARKKHPGIVVVWFIHFPPRVFPLHYVLRNYHLIEQASKTLDVAVVLSGHTHKNEPFAAGAGSAIWNAGSATQYAEPNGNWFQILEFEITNDNLVRATRRNFQWEVRGSTHDFFEDPNPDKIVP